MKHVVLTAAAFALIAQAGVFPTPVHAQQAGDAIATALADPLRPAADTARDALRKPAEIIAFAGVEPGMTVIEYAPGGGYYTRLLSRVVGPEGKVYALVPAAFAQREGALDGLRALAEQYGNVEVIPVDFANFMLPEQADLAWTTENYHDFVNGPDIAGINAATFSALKPGGTFFVEDHDAPGTGTSATRTLHRIDAAAVKEQVTAAGFTLEAESDALDNPNDPHDVSPREVQPTSDKFALRFRKPG
ncbi:MAG: class I SAM-dependent methyltransferase [Croceibacterium sp.]|jgi:predicted methyltransferase